MTRACAKHFDKFIVCEAKFTHSGKEKKLNFNIKKFTEFKKKIIYLVQDNEPSDLSPDNKLNKRSNAIKRVACQRNKLAEGLSNADSNDLIFYSDNDEIPDLKNVNLETINKKIIIFEQKLFYYKFNLYLDRIHWYGTRALRKKNLRTFELLREIKPKKYSFYRIDTLFNEKKFIDLHVVKNGGWHFTRILSPQEIHSRELETEHSDEYLESKKDSKKIEDLIRRKVIDHNHLADKRENKFGEEFDLKLYPVKNLPDYIENNQIKYKNYLDLE